jgi:hypothetical protein
VNEIDNDKLFLEWIVFSDEATFHISGHVRRHNIGCGATNIHTPLLNMSVIVRKLMFGVGLHMIE